MRKGDASRAGLRLIAMPHQAAPPTRARIMTASDREREERCGPARSALDQLLFLAKDHPIPSLLAHPAELHIMQLFRIYHPEVLNASLGAGRRRCDNRRMPAHHRTAPSEPAITACPIHRCHLFGSVANGRSSERGEERFGLARSARWDRKEFWANTFWPANFRWMDHPPRAWRAFVEATHIPYATVLTEA